MFILIFFFVYTTGAPYMPGNFFFAIDGFLKVVTGVRFSCGCINGSNGSSVSVGVGWSTWTAKPHFGVSIPKDGSWSLNLPK